MNQKINFENILFLDIETVPEERDFASLSEEKKELFALKTQYQRKDVHSPSEFYSRAGIWAEFGKIVCISTGFFANFNSINRTFHLKSFYGEELQLLKDFKNYLETQFDRPQHLLCGHNAKEFDFPFISRRMVINHISLPEKLNLFGKKPWQVSHLDTMELWKFGDYKHYSSLRLLTSILGIPTPKDDIDGSMVGEVYYKEKDIERIRLYCEKDTVAVAQVLLRFNNKPLIKSNHIVLN